MLIPICDRPNVSPINTNTSHADTDVAHTSPLLNDSHHRSFRASSTPTLDEGRQSVSLKVEGQPQALQSSMGEHATDATVSTETPVPTSVRVVVKCMRRPYHILVGRFSTTSTSPLTVIGNEGVADASRYDLPGGYLVSTGSLEDQCGDILESQCSLNGIDVTQMLEAGTSIVSDGEGGIKCGLVLAQCSLADDAADTILVGPVAAVAGCLEWIWWDVRTKNCPATSAPEFHALLSRNHDMFSSPMVSAHLAPPSP
jgi:hypothetical protein